MKKNRRKPTNREFRKKKQLKENITYWQKRDLERAEKVFQNAEEQTQFILKAYQDAINDIEKEVVDHLTKLSDKLTLLDGQVVTLADAKRLLSYDELSKFKLTLNNFRNKSKGVITPAVEKELEILSRRVRISRLQALEGEIKARVASLMAEEERLLKSHLIDTYQTIYSETISDLAWLGIDGGIPRLDIDVVEKAINRPWAEDGVNFSQRIWGRNEKLIPNLRKEITRSIMTGARQEDIAERIAKKLETSYYNASRLVYTETTAIYSEAKKESYNEAGFEYVKISATLDHRTSDICRDLDGEIVPMELYKTGVTVPPFHPNCRSVAIPYFDDDIQKRITTTRMARNPITGKSERVKNVQYHEWNKQQRKPKNKIKPKSPPQNDGKRKGKITEFEKHFGNINKDMDIKEMVNELYRVQGFDKNEIPISYGKMKSSYGQVRFRRGDKPGTVKATNYNIDIKTQRPKAYKQKTVFHEGYHLNIDGKVSDYFNWDSIDYTWTDIEETFAETSAIYAISNLYEDKVFMPSYPDKLMYMIPKLKELDEFKSCKTLSDFGKIAWEKRLAGGGSEWLGLAKRLEKKDSKWQQYGLKYKKELIEKSDEIFNIIAEARPEYKDFKNDFNADLEEAIKLLDKGYSVRDNEKWVFTNYVAILMNMLGVR